MGPNTDPCGTPLKTPFQFDTSPSTIILSLLFAKCQQCLHPTDHTFP